MPFRNFLNRRSAAPNGGEIENTHEDNRVSTESHPSNPLSIRKSYEKEPPEYKLSVVDDNGAYLPPSPPEKQSFWKKYPGTNRSSNHRNLVDENEPFSISRESFDSYRRSFDISARSPVSYTDTMPSRTSLDSRFSHMSPQSTPYTNGFSKPEAMEEEKFEDVGLDDEEVKPKKKGIFSRFSDFSGDAQTSGNAKPASQHHGFHIPGRKKGSTAVESELVANNTYKVDNMVGVKRPVDAGDERNRKRTKTKTAPVTTKKAKSAPVKKSVSQKSSKKDVKSGKKDKKTSKRKVEEEEEDFDDEDDFDIDDIPDSEADEDDDEDVEMGSPSDGDEDDVQEEKKQKTKAPAASTKAEPPKNINASREAHAKQKTLLQERKAAKPNADIIARSKQLWERLRRKSHVPLEERKKLIAELFDIIKGRVKDFVFKHDSVRVIQTALKYANIEQRKQIAQELKGHYKELAQSRYAKFLVGKLLVHGDTEVRDLIIPEFCGHVKRLIRHPEGSWILDDVYRTVATKEQRATLLREWYGPEFSIFKDEHASAELSEILEKNPEKRSPIMHFLHEMINQLVQKRSTGFTMLHDAMLQYFLNTKPGSSEANEFIELLKGDEEGDLLKNLAFTKSGSRVMCLSLAYSNAKDRKLLTRAYRDTIKMMAGDLHGHMVLLAAYEVIDDTKLTSKLIFPELLNQGMEEEARNDELLYQVNDLTARIPVLFPFAGDRVKWLVPEVDQEVLKEIREIRKETSKKEPAVRRQELVKAASPTLLSFIAARAESLLDTSFGCQFIAEVLFDADGDKTAALSAVATAAKAKSDMQDSPFFGRLLKSLVQGGRFNTAEKVVEKVQPPLNFHALLYEQIKDEIMTWATGPNTFVVVALTESDEFAKKDELLKTLKKGKKQLEQASAESGKDGKKAGPTSSGAKLLLEKIR
ncbi:hypothetical protein CNMCM5793_006640 [Aspergillus hiratsukae]|uniref:PUM-HD domain-containing protein n=1 Tax=Aspergillus hiratsukae TaxID=1194566 RepID=A0A8H6P5D8_9EURO|nr:hypothetical protein CNMCM5793_006640 [Aspergillus hiratsukae]